MRKKTLAAALFFLLLSSPALAAWTDDFTKDYDKFGLDVAVENALANDVAPQAILDYVVKNKDKFSEHMSLKALYCSGVDVDVVDRAASALGIIPQDIKSALQQSVEECGSKIALTDRDIIETEMPAGDSGLPGTPPADAGAPPVNPPATAGGTAPSGGTGAADSGSVDTAIVPPPPPVSPSIDTAIDTAIVPPPPPPPVSPSIP